METTSGAPLDQSLLEAEIEEGSLLDPDADELHSEDGLPDSQLVVVESGAELSVQDCTILAANVTPRVIIIGGEEESGKTTLISAIYQSLIRGPVDALGFYSSLSLIAFEERCYFARVVSGQSIPGPKRTEGTKMRFLHLEVVDVPPNDPVTLLMSDVSGEVFRKLRESNITSELDSIRSADHFVLMIDGAALCDPVRRGTAKLNAIITLRRLLEDDLLRGTTHCQIVFNKIDFIKKSKEALGILKEMSTELASLLNGRVASTAIFEVDSLSMLVSENGDKQIPELLRRWCDEPRVYRAGDGAAKIDAFHSIDEFQVR